MGSLTTSRLGIRPSQISSTENVSLQQYYYGERLPRSVDEQKPFKRRRLNRLKNDSEMDVHVKCTACPKIFKRNSEIISHVFEHIEPDETGEPVIRERRHPLRQSNLRCYICMKKTSMDSISVHIKHSHEMKNHEFTCRICELFYGNKRDLIIHMHHTHPCLDMPYSCDICGYQSSFRTAVFKHFEETHQKNYVMCSFCMTIMPVETVPDMKNLERHLLQHVLSSGERCIRCALKFISVADLQDHVAQKHQRLSDATKIEDIKIYKLNKGEDPIYMKRPVRRDPRAPRTQQVTSVPSSTITSSSSIAVPQASVQNSQVNLHQVNTNHNNNNNSITKKKTDDANDSDDGLEIVFERIVAPILTHNYQNPSDSTTRSVIQRVPGYNSSSTTTSSSSTNNVKSSGYNMYPSFRMSQTEFLASLGLCRVVHTFPSIVTAVRPIIKRPL